MFTVSTVPPLHVASKASEQLAHIVSRRNAVNIEAKILEHARN